MAKIEATANRGKQGERTYAVELDIPGTNSPEYDTYFGGAHNVRAGHLAHTIVDIQAAIRAMAESGVDKATGKPWTQAQIQAKADAVIARIRAGERRAKADKVGRLIKDVAKLSPEERAALLAQLSEEGEE